MRLSYGQEKETFVEDDLISKEPYANFEHWFNEACETPDVLEPNGMALATSAL